MNLITLSLVYVNGYACPCLYCLALFFNTNILLKNLRTSTYVFPLFNTESLISKIENIFLSSRAI